MVVPSQVFWRFLVVGGGGLCSSRTRCLVAAAAAAAVHCGGKCDSILDRTGWGEGRKYLRNRTIDADMNTMYQSALLASWVTNPGIFRLILDLIALVVCTLKDETTFV